MDRAVRGEPDATAALLSNVQPGVIRYCRARLGKTGGAYTTADDISQEVCIALLTALPRYRQQGVPFSAFVYGIAARKVTDAQRAAMKLAVPAIDTTLDRPDTNPGPEQQAVNADQARLLYQLLSHLPETQREIVVLRVAVGLSADEVGQRAGHDVGGGAGGAVAGTRQAAQPGGRIVRRTHGEEGGMNIDNDDALLDALGRGEPAPEGDTVAKLLAAWHSEISDRATALRPAAMPAPKPRNRSAGDRADGRTPTVFLPSPEPHRPGRSPCPPPPPAGGARAARCRAGGEVRSRPGCAHRAVVRSAGRAVGLGP